MDEKTNSIVINNNCCCCGKGTGGGAAEQSWENYSLDEIAIGTWIDGKTIYRKVIEGKLAVASGEQQIFAKVPSLRIDRMINLYGNFTCNKDNTSHATLQTSFNLPRSIEAAVNMWYQSDSTEIQYQFLNNGGGFSGRVAYVILEYTKQTDEPTTD